MAPRKKFTLPEGLSLNLTCRFRKGPKSQITWQKDGVDISSMDNHQSAKIIQTDLLSMLMLTNLRRMDAGNYSCQSVRKSEPISQWMDIQVKDRNEYLKESRTVADEPHYKCQGEACKKSCTDQSNCEPKLKEPLASPQFSPNDSLSLNMVKKDLPLIRTVEPPRAAFQLGNAKEFHKYDEYVNSIQLLDDCDNSIGGCTDRSTTIIGIGTMCSFFFIAVIVSSFFIRRKILRQRRLVFWSQKRNLTTIPLTSSGEHALKVAELSPHPNGHQLSNISAISPGSAETFHKVKYIERTTVLGDVICIPQSGAMVQHCSCGEASSGPSILDLSTKANPIVKGTRQNAYLTKETHEPFDLQQSMVQSIRLNPQAIV